MALTLQDLQPFIDFVNANLSIKTFTSQSLSTWQATSGKPLVNSGVGYGVALGNFPTVPVTSVNGMTGDVVLTKADIGLSNVPDVDCTNASNITTGVLPLSVIPAAALERLIHVTDEAARFALTVADVQNGDVVQQDDTLIMYKVVDDTNLDNATGYNEFVAGIAAAVNWSGVLNVPQNLLDIALADTNEKAMLVYFSGQWVSRSPDEVRYNLDIPVKGAWDMSDVISVTPIDPYPVLDLDPTTVGAAAFPSISVDNKSHGFTLQEGSSAGAPLGMLALTTAMILPLTETGDVADLPFPIPGHVNAIAIELELGASTFPQLNPTFFPSILSRVSLRGRDSATAESFQLQLEVSSNTATAQFYWYISAVSGGSQSGSSSTAVTLPHTTRVVVYVDGDTRRVGMIVDGVDTGWVLDGDSSEVTVPPHISSLGIYKQSTFTDIAAGDPIIGDTCSTYHSITLADITETVPGNLTEWGTESVGPPVAPAGVEVTNRFFARPGGTFNGVTAADEDIVEFLSSSDIFVYPRIDSVVRTWDLDIQVSRIDDLETNVGNLQGAVESLQTSMTLVQQDVADLILHDRTLRERFLGAGGIILGFSRTGNDFDSGYCLNGDGTEAVIVTEIAEDGTYTGLGGYFAANGALIGQIAVRNDADGWDFFTPKEGDEYNICRRVYGLGADPIKLIGKIRCAYNVGSSERSYRYSGSFANPKITQNFSFAGAVSREQGNEGAGFIEQPFSNLNGFADIYSMTGWEVIELPKSRMGRRVNFVLVDTPFPINIVTSEDDITVLVVANTMFGYTVDVRLLTTNSMSDMSGLEGSLYPSLAATSKGRVIVWPQDGDTAITTDTPIPVRVFRNRMSNGVQDLHIATFLYRSSDIQRPWPAGDELSIDLPLRGMREHKAMIFDYEFFPLAGGAGTGFDHAMGDLGHIVTRVDGNDSVAYSYSTGIPPVNQYSPSYLLAHTEMLYFTGIPNNTYNPYTLRPEYQLVLPAPVRAGQRILVNFGTAVPSGTEKVWTTATTLAGAAPVGFDAPTWAALNNDGGIEAEDTFEFVAVRDVLAANPPDVTLGNELVWRWLRVRNTPALTSAEFNTESEVLTFERNQGRADTTIDLSRRLRRVDVTAPNSYTLVSGKEYWINDDSTTNLVTLNLPAAPQDTDTVRIHLVPDGTTLFSGNVTVSGNGNLVKPQGVAASATRALTLTPQTVIAQYESANGYWRLLITPISMGYVADSYVDRTSYAGALAGRSHLVSGLYSAVGGGYSHIVSGARGFVGNGNQHQVLVADGFIGAGNQNTITSSTWSDGTFGFVLNGDGNISRGKYGGILNGVGNQNSYDYEIVINGRGISQKTGCMGSVNEGSVSTNAVDRQMRVRSFLGGTIPASGGTYYARTTGMSLSSPAAGFAPRMCLDSPVSGHAAIGVHTINITVTDDAGNVAVGTIISRWKCVGGVTYTELTRDVDVSYEDAGLTGSIAVHAITQSAGLLAISMPVVLSATSDVQCKYDVLSVYNNVAVA